MATATFKIILNVFKLAFIIIFVYQMLKGTEKFIQGPVYNEKMKINLDKYPQPVIYICSKASFNYTVARMNGYESQFGFMLGDNVESNLTSWKGSSPHMIYDILGGHLEGLNITLKMKKVFRIPDGVCYRSEDFEFEDVTGLSSSKVGYKLHIIDPYKDSPFSIGMPAIRGPHIEIRGFEKGFAVSQWFDVRFTVHDQSIKHGQDCKDYTKEGSSYGQCIHDATRDSLIKLLGCLPPWFSPEKGNCTSMKRISGLKRDQLSSLVHTLLFKRPLNITEHCKPSCLQMYHRVTKLDDRKLYDDFDNNFLFLFSNSEANLIKETWSYDIFDLCVEIGSALGLWIGLSALGIIDLGLGWILDCINCFLKRDIIK